MIEQKCQAGYCPELVCAGCKDQVRALQAAEETQQRASQPAAEYVVGYCFNMDKSFVALIEKLKPAWQAEKLNGVGGKVEPGETLHEAMSREFREEAGLFVPPQFWLHIRTEHFGAEQESARGQPVGARVHHFAASVGDAQWADIRSMERERIVKVQYPLGPRTLRRVIYNLPYLVPMAAVLLEQPPENRPVP